MKRPFLSKTGNFLDISVLVSVLALLFAVSCSLDRTVEAGLKHKGASMSPVFLDYDVDGDLDLLVVNYGPDPGARVKTSHPFNATNGQKKSSVQKRWKRSSFSKQFK